MDIDVLFIIAVLGLLLLGAVGAIMRQRKRHRQSVEALEDRAADKLGALSTEHDKRVKRLTREWQGVRETVHLSLASDLLPAFDAVESALESTHEDADIADGLQLIRKEMLAAFAKHGIERIAPEPGAEFDPEWHEAVDTVEADEQTPKGTVARCHRAGYRHPGRVLRPAMVTVARG